MAGSGYLLSPQAEADLDAIWLYTAENWSNEQADRYIRDIISGCMLLAGDGNIGRRVDIRDGYLKYPVGSHFIYFRRSDFGVSVVRILHQRMDVARHI